MRRSHDNLIVVISLVSSALAREFVRLLRSASYLKGAKLSVSLYARNFEGGQLVSTNIVAVFTNIGYLSTVRALSRAIILRFMYKKFERALSCIRGVI